VRIVHSANSADSDPTPTQEALVVSGDSDIKTLKDLEGKTIACNSLNNTPHLAVLTTLEEAGVDWKSVKFVEVGFPDMALALEKGRIDAADISEPFLTVAKQAGDRLLAAPYREVKQDLPLSSWFTTQEYLDSNSDVAERFYRAVEKSNAYAQAHQDEMRQYAVDKLGVDQKLADEMALPRYPEGTPSVDVLQMLADKSEHYGFAQGKIDDVPGILANIS
jgi:NitT/TauT family transport system substrate-binding protein